MAWQVPKIWSGGTAFIIGGGPSLSSVDLDKLKGRRIVGANNAYTLMPWMDFLYFMDCVWFKWHEKALLDFKGIKVTVCHHCRSNSSIRVLQRGEKFALDDRPGYLSCGSNSGYGAIALAVKLGAKEIVLLGFDMQQTEGRSNFHTEHKRQMKADIYKDNYLKTFGKMIPHLSYNGVQIYNATEGSALECFPKRPLEKFL